MKRDKKTAELNGLNNIYIKELTVINNYYYEETKNKTYNWIKRIFNLMMNVRFFQMFYINKVSIDFIIENNEILRPIIFLLKYLINII